MNQYLVLVIASSEEYFSTNVGYLCRYLSRGSVSRSFIFSKAHAKYTFSRIENLSTKCPINWIENNVDVFSSIRQILPAFLSSFIPITSRSNFGGGKAATFDLRCLSIVSLC